MTTLILLSIAGLWVLLSAIILISVCMLSSRLSRAEEARDLADFCENIPQGATIGDQAEIPTTAPARVW